MLDIAKLEKKLLSAARLESPSDRVPYAFEQRVMARIKAAPEPDCWALWAGALWRASAASVAAVVLLGAWGLAVGGYNGDDLGQELETTIYAAVDAPGDSW